MSAPRTCDELGLCQGRTPRCTGCTDSCFGPAEVPAAPNDRQISMLMTWALVWAAATSTVAALMFVLGALS